ncbi:MAG TPA: lysophospholipid acyltransferase family protein [Anaerolineales bacterium]|jgi:1-acyl-sn-glycerol-3-phosphate acyltransferase|nr:lysophospholipid acyltransferase family protein [Anaerolineales bacterium]
MSEANSDYRVSWRTKISRRLARPLFRTIFHLLSRVSISGTENILSGQPYLIAINHVSLIEPPFVLAFWPQPPEAVGASDIWNRAGQAGLARMYGAIPVHRGEYNRRLLQEMVAVLRAGRPLMIAPEGGRSHAPGMRRAFPGVAYVVDKAQVPVIPAGIVGATEDFLKRALRADRPVLELHIGVPIYLPPVEGRGEARRAALQRNADLIMQQIAALLPTEYGGVYAINEFRGIETT